jgi:hypothetical protein
MGVLEGSAFLCGGFFFSFFFFFFFFCLFFFFFYLQFLLAIYPKTLAQVKNFLPLFICLAGRIL